MFEKYDKCIKQSWTSDMASTTPQLHLKYWRNSSFYSSLLFDHLLCLLNVWLIKIFQFLVTNFSLLYLFLSRINFSSFFFVLVFFWMRIQNVLLPSCLYHSTVLLLLLNKYISLFYLLTSMGVFHHTHKFFFIIIIIISGSFAACYCISTFFYDISFALNIYIVRVSSDQFVAMSHAIIFGHLFRSLDFKRVQLDDMWLFGIICVNVINWNLSLKVFLFYDWGEVYFCFIFMFFVLLFWSSIIHWSPTVTHHRKREYMKNVFTKKFNINITN